MRNPRLLALLIVAAVALAAIPAAAIALPTDPPIEPLSPADGTGLYAAETGSVHLTFKCPKYHKDAEQLGEDLEYRVRFSTSSDRDAEGLISTNLGSELALPDENTSNATCSVEFQAPPKARPTALYQGTVYWQVSRPVKRGAPETPKQKEEREDKELEDEEKEDEAADNGTAFVPNGEFEGGPVRSFSLQPKVEEAELTTQRVVYAGYLSPIEFSSLTELEGGTIELQRLVKGAWQPLRSESVTDSPTNFFVKLPAGKVVLRPVAKSATVTLPLEQRTVIVHKLKHRLTSAEEDGRYKQKQGKKKSKESAAETPKLPLSFAVVDGGTRVAHLRATIEGTCKATTRSGQDVPLKMKTALLSARIAPDGTVIADRATKGPEPQQVVLTGQLLAGSLIGTISTTYKNCHGSRKFEAVPLRKKK
jgi:hypothetical protein